MDVTRDVSKAKCGVHKHTALSKNTTDLEKILNSRLGLDQEGRAIEEKSLFKTHYNPKPITRKRYILRERARVIIWPS